VEANISSSESTSKELLNDAESREMNSTTKYLETPGRLFGYFFAEKSDKNNMAKREIEIKEKKQ